MENKCHCYHTEKKRRYTYNQFTGAPIAHDIDVGVCWGTKECDECNCGGDETQCDFYPEVRKKAKKKLNKGNSKIGEDYLVVTYDCSLSDAPTLCVGRTNGDNLKILNIFHGDKALGIYALLTDYAELKDLND